MRDGDKNEKGSLFLELFGAYFKIGLFTFGGGYAMIAVIENICVEKKKWITHDDMVNLTVIAESTPGPIAVNCATFVGYKQGGFLGALFATLGVVLPSFIIIFALASVLDRLIEIKAVASAFAGIRIAVGLLIISAAVNMIGKMKKSAFSVSVLIIACLLMLAINIFSLKISVIVLMLAGAAAGLLHCAFNRKSASSSGGKDGAK
ncbi:MAG: chromate transporter [Clostridia bacterium]|nr:chromate transporter [Clostridia bacterium]